MPQSKGKLVGVHATGRLTKADYDGFLPRLEALFDAHGKLDAVFYMDSNFEGWDMAASWEDASYGLRHRADFGRLAVVGGPEWVNWCIKLSGFLLKGEIRLFAADEFDKAWAWVGDSA